MYDKVTHRHRGKLLVQESNESKSYVFLIVWFQKISIPHHGGNWTFWRGGGVVSDPQNSWREEGWSVDLVSWCPSIRIQVSICLLKSLLRMLQSAIRFNVSLMFTYELEPVLHQIRKTTKKPPFVLIYVAKKYVETYSSSNAAARDTKERVFYH